MAYNNRQGPQGQQGQGQQGQGSTANRSQTGMSGQGTSGQSTEQKAKQVTERVADQAQSTFENAREKVTTQFNAVARAIESAAGTLQQEQQHGLAKRVHQYVRKAETASQYLRDKSPRELMNDLDHFARQRPAWFLGGAFLAGLLGARFLKSSEKNVMKGPVEYARS